MQLHLGDCLEILPSIPDHSVHLILTDLPYGTTCLEWDKVLPLDKLWDQYKRVLTKNGAVVLTASQPFTTMLGASNLPWLRYALVWEKNRATGFLHAPNKPLKKHEDILVFSPGAAVHPHQSTNRMTYNPQGLTKLDKPVKSRNGKMKDSYTGPYKGEYGKKCDEAKDMVGPRPDGKMFAGKPVTGGGSKFQTHTNYPTSILKFDVERKTVHPTQKPVALMEYLIRTFSNEGETVLDNCMGSGTTGVAARRANRDFIGIEMDPKFFAYAEERINHPLPF